MALPRSIPRLARLALSPGVRARSDVRPRDSCEPTPAPPCPPCAPPPRPPCRARAPERVRALRVTCCPPSRGMRPPCEPPLPACALDCTQAKPHVKECRTQTTAVYEENCDAGRDRVAARLNASKNACRQEYMREVRERRPGRAPSTEPYRLPGERECARATDGRLYTIAPSPPPRPAPPLPAATVSRACGPCREPPPPKCVEIIPDNECQVRGPNFVDPCSHRPRVIVSIDRSKTRDTRTDPKDYATSEKTASAKDYATSEKTASAKDSATSEKTACAKRPPEGGITSRIMKSLSLSRGGGGESSRKCAPRPSSGAGGKAQYAGDTGWCGTIQPKPAPPHCRPPSREEQLRRRACRDIPCGQPPNKRGLHTTAPARSKAEPKDMKTMAAKFKENVEKLEKMLNTRASLKEAAKGRTVDCSPKEAVSASAGLELPVPPGAEAVRVKVSLDPSRRRCAPAPSSAAPRGGTFTPGTERASPCAARAAAVEVSVPPTVPPGSVKSPICVSRAVPTDGKCDSWLSIKSLHKKIAETCRIPDTSKKDTCKDPCQPKPSPCAPPPKTSNPKAPSKKSDSDQKKKKPTCCTPASSHVVTLCK